jgi:predicted aspartyl protease
MSVAARAQLRCFVPVVFLLLALPIAGCSDHQADRNAAPTEVVTQTEVLTQTEPTPTTAGGSSQAVKLRVVSGPGGVFAFLKVYIRGKGPFAFTVDTGASHSVVDYDVVRKLGLKTIGDPVTVTGITCRGTAGRLRMAKWRAGAVTLPATEIQTIDMPEPGGGIEIDGLLGSDVLSTFGAITVDYRSERLVLPAPA